MSEVTWEEEDDRPNQSMTAAGLSVETRPLDDTGSTGLSAATSAALDPFICCHVCSLLKHCLLCHSSACCLT
ncbi:unnamed protein product, partial [Staurois parvus]